MKDAKLITKKLECYRMKTNPNLCTSPDCPYNNKDPVYGFYCCSNKLLYDTVQLLKEQEQKIFELEGQLRLLEYGDQEAQNGVMMPAT